MNKILKQIRDVIGLSYGNYNIFPPSVDWQCSFEEKICGKGDLYHISMWFESHNIILLIDRSTNTEFK